MKCHFLPLSAWTRRQQQQQQKNLLEINFKEFFFSVFGEYFISPPLASASTGYHINAWREIIKVQRFRDDDAAAELDNWNISSARHAMSSVCTSAIVIKHDSTRY